MSSTGHQCSNPVPRCSCLGAICTPSDLAGSLSNGQFGCPRNEAYNATLLELELAAPNACHELLLPANSSTLFSGTSVMRQVSANVIAANRHRLIKVESCEADASDAMRMVSCIIDNETPCGSSPNSIRRWTFADESTLVTIDNHWLQSSLHTAPLRRFLLQHTFDFAVIVAPHKDSFWDSFRVKSHDPAEVRAVLKGEVPKPSWWIDLSAKESTNLTQLCSVYGDAATHLVRIAGWRIAETGCNPAAKVSGLEADDANLLAPNDPGLCATADCGTGGARSHLCNPGVPTWFAVHLSRLRCLLAGSRGCNISPEHFSSRGESRFRGKSGFKRLPTYVLERAGLWAPIPR